MPEGTVRETRIAIQIIHPGVNHMEGKNSDGMGISWGKISSFDKRPRRYEK